MNTNCFVTPSVSMYVLYDYRLAENDIFEVHIVAHDKYCNVQLEDTLIIDVALEGVLFDIVKKFVENTLSTKINK